MKKGLLPLPFGVGAVVGVSALVFFMFAPLAFASHAPAPQELHGYAWSSTIGWIGFNCADSAPPAPGAAPARESAGGRQASSCATSDFKVVKQPDGTLTGYGWSSSVGWVTFTPQGPYPKDPFTPVPADFSARFSDTTLTGWARACSVFAAGPNDTQECGAGDDTLRPDSERGGWDGWIKLSGKTGDGGAYSVTLGSASPDGKRSFSGFSWGADIIGWVNWIGVFLTEPLPDLTAETPTISGLAPTGNPNEYYTGLATLSGTVRNTGSGDAPGSFINQYRFALSSDGPFYSLRDAGNLADLTFPLTETSALPHGTSRTVAPHSFATGPGTWYLQLCADFPVPGAVAETNERNNCSAAPLRIVIVEEPPPPPPPTITVRVPSCSEGEGKLTVSWTPVTGALKYRLYRRAASADSFELITTTDTTSFSDALLSPSATYSYRVEASRNGVTWSAPSPRSPSASPSVACPDLVIENIQVINAADSSVYDPATVPVNTAVRFRAVVRNQGGGTEVRFDNQFFVDGKSSQPSATRPTSLQVLGGGLSAQILSVLGWSSAVTGPHTLEVCADRPPDDGKGLVKNESDEDNNCRTLPFTVVPPPPPLTATLECYDPIKGYRTDYCIVDYGTRPKLRWNTTGASTCTAKGDWSEEKPLLGGGGIENVALPPKGKSGNPFEYSFELECSR